MFSCHKDSAVFSTILIRSFANQWGDSNKHRHHFNHELVIRWSNLVVFFTMIAASALNTTFRKYSPRQISTSRICGQRRKLPRHDRSMMTVHFFLSDLGRKIIWDGKIPDICRAGSTPGEWENPPADIFQQLMVSLFFRRDFFSFCSSHEEF